VAQLAIGLAISVGANLLLSLFQPAKEGPRVSDLSVSGSSYGQQIPKIWGRMRVPVNVVWSLPIQESSTTSKGGKGTSAGKETTYSYSGSFAGLACEGPIFEFGRIWINGEIQYNVLTWMDSDTVGNSRNLEASYFRQYPGDLTQNRDPLIEGVEGTDNTFAYRNRALLVIENYPLETVGNRIPQMQVEVVTEGSRDGQKIVPDIISLGTVLKDLCAFAGIDPENVDTTDVDCLQVIGYFLNGPTSVRSAIEQLQPAYLFDCVESGDKLLFKKQDRPPTVAIPFSRLATREYGNSRPPNYEETRLDENQLPREVSLTYIDPDIDFQKNVARATREISPNQNIFSLNIPLVLTATQARTAAEQLLYWQWLGRNRVKFSLPYRYLYLEDGDVVSLNLHGTTQDWKIERINIGANLILEVDARLQSGASGSIASGGTVGTLFNQTVPVTSTPRTGGDQQVVVAGNTNLKLLDIPLIEDNDTDIGIYVSAAGGLNWRRGSLYVSRDGGTSYALALTIAQPSIQGVCSTTLVNYTGAFGTLDTTSTVRVTLDYGTLASVSLARMNAGENVALIGNEIIRFQTATLISPGTYDLSNLLRGRRGTDWARSGHVSSERFVYLAGTGAYINRLDAEAFDIGQTIYFKALSPGQDLTAVSAQTLVFNGVSLECYSPIALAATRDDAGNIRINWTRRDRRAGDRTDYANFPLSEVTEKYEIEIRNAGDTATLRTLTTVTPTVRYTSAQQITDFGAAQTSITVRIYQISALVGRGYPATATLTVGLSSVAPTITDFAPRSGAIGDTITVYGSGFTGATALSVNGIACTSRTVISDTEINGVIAAGTTSGLVSVTAPGGTVNSSVLFVVGAAGGGGATLTLEEVDGTPSVASVTKIILPNGSLTNVGGGVVSVTMGGGGGGGTGLLSTVIEFAGRFNEDGIGRGS
jgi:Putative phage tail protein